MDVMLPANLFAAQNAQMYVLQAREYEFGKTFNLLNEIASRQLFVGVVNSGDTT